MKDSNPKPTQEEPHIGPQNLINDLQSAVPRSEGLTSGEALPEGQTPASFGTATHSFMESLANMDVNNH